MKVWTFCITYNEAKMIRWFLRHYEQWCEKMIFYDGKSTDGTREIIKAHPKAELRDWPLSTGLDDEAFRTAVSTWYKEAVSKADWVICPDADELLIHPDPLKVLSETKADMIGSTGYALISPTGWPEYAFISPHDSKSQLYDLVKTGVPQSNYDKWICHRPTVNIQVAHGKHTYRDATGRFEWPKCSGVIDPVPRFRLLHCRHVGGAGETAVRNQRNYDRAHEKRFAWNMTAEHNKPEQNGSEAWVRAAIVEHKLKDVVSDFMPKLVGKCIQFGAGGLNLPAPWINHDMDCDISKPLPYKHAEAEFISAGHVIEHLTPQQAWSFLEECWRILKPGGVVRIVFPDLARMAAKMTPEYIRAVKDGGHGNNPIRATVFSHGHQGAWTEELMIAVMEAIGFKAKACPYGKSDYNELHDVEMHHRTVGINIALVETTCVEGVKP